MFVLKHNIPSYNRLSFYSLYNLGSSREFHSRKIMLKTRPVKSVQLSESVQYNFTVEKITDFDNIIIVLF